MKSSITTTSAAPPSLGPSGVLPLVMRTRATRSPASNRTPRNDHPLSCGCAEKTPRLCPPGSKNSSVAVFGPSTSLNTTPKAFTVAARSVPGTDHVASVTVLPRGLKSRYPLKPRNV
jgi:hypothetical protein